MQHFHASCRVPATRRIMLLIAVCSILAGCPKANVGAPEELADRGLVVGRVYVESAHQVTEAHPVISKQLYENGMRNGVIMVSLLPGEYELEELESVSLSQGVKTTYFITINKKFRIEKGMVTNLGLLVIDAKPQEPGRALRYAIDDSGEMMRFLKTKHARLYASLRAKVPIQAPGTYLTAAQVRQLQNEYASRTLSRKAAYYTAHPELGYFTGPFGLIAKLVRDADGRVESYQALDTGHIADMRGCSIGSNQAVCLLNASEYLQVRESGVQLRTMPAGIVCRGIYTLADGALALIDDHLNIHVSKNNGTTWRRYSGLARATSVGPNEEGEFGFHAGRKGFYIFTNATSGPPTLVYFEYGGVGYARMLLPREVDRVASVHETEAGLIIFSDAPNTKRRRMFLKPKGKDAWQAKDAPCSEEILFEDRAGQKMQAYCGGNSVQITSDGGVTWRKMLTADSLFEVRQQ